MKVTFNFDCIDQLMKMRKITSFCLAFVAENHTPTKILLLLQQLSYKINTNSPQD